MHEAERLLRAAPFASLLGDVNVTDITYNGEALYYVSSLTGRQYYKDYDKSEALNLIRQIANFTNQLFTYQNPVLDVVFARYRLSAVHPLIGRGKEDSAISFALRVANDNKHLLEEKGTITPHLSKLLKNLVTKGKSLVISGQTGVGKTEVQKYLIGLLKVNSRIVIIDQGIELALCKTLYPSLDITIWRFENRLKESELENLIKTSLRFNPDYIVVAEARGAEIIDIYNATLSGHPSIFTIHSENEHLIYERMVAMTSYKVPLTKQDFAQVFPYIIHLEKVYENDAIKRKVKSIVEFDRQRDTFNYLYKDEN